ncbi:PadR family transcriptional regulator [Olivibacter sitiensis]|uniref:PadR family transcriptional regulator n=1 Tax=Olivibacter sitiensis TaxID=376470 RepID=UPI0004077D7B|nr:PadR family transcriptional regulator [Olivibacter sitiensis]
MKEISKELMASSLAPIILLILRRQESYGYEIIQEIERLSGKKLAVAEGTLYPILKKMEAKEWIAATWKTGSTGKERRYYALTQKGHIELDSQYEQWNFLHDLINTLWKSPNLTYNRL